MRDRRTLQFRDARFESTTILKYMQNRMISYRNYSQKIGFTATNITSYALRKNKIKS